MPTSREVFVAVASRQVKLFYYPFSIVAGIIGARTGRKAFAALWGEISDSPKPAPTAPDVGLATVAVSAALEGATIAASAAIAHQLTVRVFHHLFGFWPVKQKQPGV
jgi:Protein of unknown function (DUF4235)